MKPLIFTAILVVVCGGLLWAVRRAEKAERNKKPNDGTFDERQALARGRAAANAVLYLCRGQLIENGLLTRKVIYVGLSAQYIATLIAVALRSLRAKREDAEDGEGT